MANGTSLPVRVIIADDHRLMRIGLRKILEVSPDISVIADASNGREAIDLAQELQPDVLLLDVEMPDLSGIEVTRQLKQNNSPVNILIISAHNEPNYIQEVLNLGAAGYLTKDEAPLYLIRAVIGTAEGKKGWIGNGPKRAQ